MKTKIENTLKNLFESANPSLDLLSIRIECPFDSGIGVQCEGKTSSGTVYPEPDMDALSDFIDEVRTSHPNESFNIVEIRMTSPTDVVIERTFDEAFQREAEELVRD
ncbi:MAG: hypothetical protein IJI36_06635 [Kiritimatiellae bacterium]|nr:hypothetical protein [Kiritimatiellia bacterium]